MKQNITLRLDKELIQKARVLAARQRSSISGMLAKELEKVLEKADRYESARKKAIATLNRGFSLSGIKVNREALHEREDLR
jgi:post-segregation antitoxin (ccd killing protein)